MKMKQVNSILVVILLVVMAGCGGRSKQSADSSVTVDVIADYAEKEQTMQDSIEKEQTKDTLLIQDFVPDKRQISNNDIITVDVSKSYSHKEIHLQSIAEIEYVALETTDDIYQIVMIVKFK